MLDELPCAGPKTSRLRFRARLLYAFSPSVFVPSSETLRLFISERKQVALLSVSAEYAGISRRSDSSIRMVHADQGESGWYRYFIAIGTRDSITIGPCRADCLAVAGRWAPSVSPPMSIGRIRWSWMPAAGSRPGGNHGSGGGGPRTTTARVSTN